MRLASKGSEWCERAIIIWCDAEFWECCGGLSTEVTITGIRKVQILCCLVYFLEFVWIYFEVFCMWPSKIQEKTAKSEHSPRVRTIAADFTSVRPNPFRAICFLQLLPQTHASSKSHSPQRPQTTLLIIQPACTALETIYITATSYRRLQYKKNDRIKRTKWIIKLEWRTHGVPICATFHSVFTFCAQLKNYNCKLFTLSRGGERRGAGVVQSPNRNCIFSKRLVKHMASVFTGRRRKRLWRGSSPWKAQPCSSEPSMLMPLGNTMRGIFPSALMCPLVDSSVQRSSHLEVPLSEWSQQTSILIHWTFCLNASAVTKPPSLSFLSVFCPQRY